MKLRIMRALVAGERDPDILASYQDVRCHASSETIRAALVGNDRAEHIFALAQSLDLYDTYQAKIAACDVRLEQAVSALTIRSGSTTPLPKPRFRQKPAGAPAFDVRAVLHGVLGVDLTKACLRLGQSAGFSNCFFERAIITSGPEAALHLDVLDIVRYDIPDEAPWREIVLFLPIRSFSSLFANYGYSLSDSSSHPVMSLRKSPRPE